MSTSTRPFLPSDRRRPSDTVVRLCASRLLAHVDRSDPMHIIRDRWPLDDALPVLARAASAPASTITPGWADSLAQLAVPDLISSLAAWGAGPNVLANGHTFSFGSSAGVAVPSLVPSANDVTFVQE